MLPDYPNVKRRTNEHFRRRLNQQILKHAPILAQIRRTAQHEGSQGSYEDVDNHENQIAYEKLTADASLTREEMRFGNVETIIVRCDAMARAFAEQLSAILYRTISEAAASAGNVFDAKGELTKETFLEMRRTLQLDFDPHTGDARYPTLLVNPETWERLKPALDSWDQDPEFIAALSEIDQQHKIDWHDRESSRRLVN